MENSNEKSSKFSLKNNCLNRLRSAIVSVRENYCQSRSVILVLDEYTIKLISIYIKMIELLECGVSNIEKLELKRKRFEKMHAIYLINPKDESVDKIIADFAEKKSPQYKRFHILFTSVVPSHVLEKLAKNQEIMSRLKSTFEFNQDFMALESNIFSFEMTQAFPSIYSKKASAEKTITEIANRLVTVIANMDKFWSIDILYQKPLPENNFAEFSTSIGVKFKEGLMALLKNLKKSSSPLLDKEAGKITVLILDRSIDATTPLLHDFYYQPMLYDLLDIKNNICEYEVEEDLKTEPEEEEKLIQGQKIKKKIVMTKKVQLSEEDEIFLSYRYKHIAEVLEGIPREFQKFVETNSNAQFHQGAFNSDLDVEKMAEIVRAMPQYQQILNKYVLHMKLIERCYKIFENRDLKEVGEVEQSLATGIDDEGHQTNSHKLVKSILKKLESVNVFELDKLRLALIAVICLDMVQKDKDKMMERFSFDLKKIFQKLIWLGIDVSKNTEAEKKGRTTKRISEDIRKMAKSKLSTATLDLCRYTGILENFMPIVLQELSKGNDLALPNFEKISINEQKQETSVSNLSKSIRVNTNEIALKEVDYEEKNKEAQKLIVFMTGGLSFSEIRAIRNLKSSNVFLILGSTSLINARDYIEGLLNMD